CLAACSVSFFLFLVVTCIIPCPTNTTLFPYTTLFRSSGAILLEDKKKDIILKLTSIIDRSSLDVIEIMELRQTIECEASFFASRSEEHTSELQSRFDLVCRLLLEKKKKKCTIATASHN